MPITSNILSKTLIRASSACIVLLGLVVIVGWHLEIPKLIQISEYLAPMQYNSALCFLISGLALGATTLAEKKWFTGGGAILLIISGLTGFQYILNVDLRIDELLFKHYIFTETSHPGRMSPVSALMFSLSGLSMICIGIHSRKLIGIRAAGLFSSLVAMLGAIAVLGYIFGLTGAYGWGQLTQMALHTACGALLIGFGLMAVCWLEEAEITGRSPVWLSFGATTGTLFATVVFWNALKSNDQQKMFQTVEARSDTIRFQIIARLESRKLALDRMALRWEFTGMPDRLAWETDAIHYVEDFPGYRAIAWVDETTEVQWLVPLAGNENVPGKVLANENRRKLAFEKARKTDMAEFSRPVDLISGGKGILLTEPLFYGEEFQGFIVGAIALVPLFESILTQDIWDGYSIRLLEDGEEIYQTIAPDQAVSQRHERRERISYAGAEWVLRTIPKLDTIRRLQSPYPKAVLLGGIVLAILLGLSILLTQTALARSEEMVSANMKLKETQAKLVETSRKAGMAEVATSVLHNVGNVLNSVNVSCSIAVRKIEKFRVDSLSKTSAMLDDRREDLGNFITEDPTGKKLPEFLGKLARRMSEEQREVLSELLALEKNIAHIKDIVSMQQSYATVSGVKETVQISQLIDDSLRLNQDGLTSSEIRIFRESDEIPPISLDTHKAIQILVNLVSNAKHACEHRRQELKNITIRTLKKGDEIEISVTDNGIGIEQENLTQIFSHGFTTKDDGHGFGLHSSALAAKQMGGSLIAASDGTDTGATFTLTLPIRLETREINPQ